MHLLVDNSQNITDIDLEGDILIHGALIEVVVVFLGHQVEVHGVSGGQSGKHVVLSHRNLEFCISKGANSQKFDVFLVIFLKESSKLAESYSKELLAAPRLKNMSISCQELTRI